MRNSPPGSDVLLCGLNERSCGLMCAELFVYYLNIDVVVGPLSRAGAAFWLGTTAPPCIWPRLSDDQPTRRIQAHGTGVRVPCLATTNLGNILRTAGRCFGFSSFSIEKPHGTRTSHVSRLVTMFAQPVAPCHFFSPFCLRFCANQFRY